MEHAYSISSQVRWCLPRKVSECGHSDTKEHACSFLSLSPICWFTPLKATIMMTLGNDCTKDKACLTEALKFTSSVMGQREGEGCLDYRDNCQNPPSFFF